MRTLDCLLLNIASLGVIVLLMTGCATETRTSSSPDRYSRSTAPTAVFKFFDKRAERKKGIPPESEWNYLGIWRRVGSEPPTYVPDGYSPSSPRTESEGTWFVDKRDGKRLFVPNTKVGTYKPSILLREASKVTDWVY